MLSHRDIIGKCLETAFETEYQLKELSNEKLEALMSLQYRLWQNSKITDYLLDDYTDKSEELIKKCSPAIKEALRRLTTDEDKSDSESLYFALIPWLDRAPYYAKKIEQLFVDYVNEAGTKDSLSPREECVFVSVFAYLHRLHASFENPDYEFTIGMEKSKRIIKEWLTSFDSESGWEELSLTECLLRIQWLNEYHVRLIGEFDYDKSDEIFLHYLQDINVLSDETYCRALRVRCLNVCNLEGSYAGEDLHRSSEILWHSEDLETKLLAASNAVRIIVLQDNNEAMALGTLPEKARKRYAKSLKIKNISSLSDKELLDSSERVLSVMNALEIEEADSWFDLENLKIADIARQLCNELIARGGSKMMSLAENIGYCDSDMPAVKKEWSSVGEENIEIIVEKTLCVENTTL